VQGDGPPDQEGLRRRPRLPVSDHRRPPFQKEVAMIALRSAAKNYKTYRKQKKERSTVEGARAQGRRKMNASRGDADYDGPAGSEAARLSKNRPSGPGFSAEARERMIYRNLVRRKTAQALRELRRATKKKGG